MGKKRDELIDGMIADDADGWLANLLAEEEPYDRRMLWQLGSWGAGALGALSLAFLAAQSSNAMRSDLASANDLVRQTQQIAQAATERETEARRLMAAINTLNSDRDRLYARVTGLEQNLDSVTSAIRPRASAALGPAQPPGASPLSSAPESIATQPSSSTPIKDEKTGAAKAPQEIVPQSDPSQSAAFATSAETDPAKTPNSRPATKSDKDKPEKEAKAAPAAAIAKPQTTESGKPNELKPAESKPAESKSTDIRLAEPQQAPPAADLNATTAHPAPASPPIITAAIPPVEAMGAEALPEIPAAKTEFGIDLGTAGSIEGLRALWRGVQTANKALMTPLRPIVTIKERAGLGMQLRLVVGPLTDAAAAARICATLSESGRSCETAFFDGQRLTQGPETPAAKPAPPAPRKKLKSSRRSVTETRPQRSNFSSFLGTN